MSTLSLDFGTRVQAPESKLPMGRSRNDSTQSSNETASSATSSTSNDVKRIVNPVTLADEISKISKANPIGLNEDDQHVPAEDLTTLLERNIRQILELPSDDNLAQFILRDAPKAFATLCLVFEQSDQYLLEAIETFKSTGFTDLKLSSDLSAKDCQQSFPTPRPWSSTRLDTFDSFRWRFLVVEFEPDVFRYSLPYQQKLPWKGKFTSKGTGSGNFSEVSCVKMIARHQKLLPPREDGTVFVALKTLKVPAEVDDFDIGAEWEREASAHGQLNNRSPHLIRAIAAYKVVYNDTKHNTYHLVLEWANGGNLLDFWHKNPSAQLSKDVNRSRRQIYDLLKQFRGLASALEFMHGAPETRQSGSHNLEMTVPQSSPQIISEESPMPVISVQEPEQETHRPDSTTDDEIGASEHDTNGSTSSTEGLGLKVPSHGHKAHTRRGSSTENWRHGDIKPENILRFIHQLNSDQTASSSQLDSAGQAVPGDVGTLKLADLGRAQRHLLATHRRSTKETEQFRTRWYEPPDLQVDLKEQSQGKISRLYDIWSLGCVILDGIIWLLYGMDAVEQFQHETPTSGEEFRATPYWIKTAPREYRVTDAAASWMEHSLQDGVKYSDALAELVALVRDRLLKVELPPNSEEYTSGRRTNAKNMGEELDRILGNAALDENYLFRIAGTFDARPPLQKSPRDKDSSISSNSSSNVSNPNSFGNSLSPLDVPKSVRAGQPTRAATSRDYTNTMKKTWQFLDDDSFAIPMIKTDQIPCDDEDLCTICKNMDMMSPTLNFDKTNAQADFDSCPLCMLVSESVARTGVPWKDPIRLEKQGDHFVTQGSDGTVAKILRLCRTGDGTNPKFREIPLGTPNLYSPESPLNGSGSFMRLPNAWIQDCDRAHGPTCGPLPDQDQLPKRLIDVRNIKKPKVVDSADITGESLHKRYIAFSHQWGRQRFSTTTSCNLAARRRGITKAELPQSFADAVAITRALGCNYLWIDSICINQRCEHDEGDFKEQAGSMQDVYTNAHCVVAASTAPGAMEGFLSRDTDAVSGSVKKGDIFVSAVTNDFDRDVLESPLAKRSWVLQERALARRTIFFTRTQMYWECGRGIRCETLRRMKHDLVSFLGDAHFPNKAIEGDSTRGTRIVFWESLFKQYSALGISTSTDRAIAIEGLMVRLSKSFKTQNLFGLFLSFWGRCLLWRRPQGAAPMTRILQGKSLTKLPPTWSWMAVQGAIDFLDPEGNKVDWNADIKLPTIKVGVTSPQLQQPAPLPLRPEDSIAEGEAIVGIALNFTTAGRQADQQAFFYDDDTQRADGQVKAVIICSSREQDQRQRKHHVLLVSEVAPSTRPPAYERVGVAVLPDSCLIQPSGITVAIG